MLQPLRCVAKAEIAQAIGSGFEGPDRNQNRRRKASVFLSVATHGVAGKTFARAGYAWQMTVYVCAHHTLFVDGDALYDAMLADIAAAQSTLRMESYIFAADRIGTRFIDALIDRARAGVSVRLHVDAMGSLIELDAASETRLIEGGVRVRHWHRWRWQRPWRIQRRNHRKLLVIDAQVAYLGGFNIEEKCARSVVGEDCWRDTHVRMSGAIASQAADAFDIASQAADAFDAGARHAVYRPQARDGATLIPNRGLRGRLLLHRLLRRRFGDARERILLTTPYFVPDSLTQRALLRAARRGVRVSVLVPAKADWRVVQWAGRAAYARLLAAGVEIWEYQPRMLHAKTIVIDGNWSTVGTANLDYRSLFINDELNAVFETRAMADALAAQFAQDLSESTQVCPNRWSQRPWIAWFAETIGWLARRWL